MTTIRASSTNQAARCHGYRTLETAETDATSDGTLFHEWTAQWLLAPTIGPSDPDEYVEFARWWESFGYGPPTDAEVEMSITIDGVDVTGHADAVWTDEDTAVVVDWKHLSGWGEELPPIEMDAQLISYGLMVRERYGVSRVVAQRVHVLQQEIHSLEITDEHEAWFRDLLAAIMADEAFSPGPHCSTCLARSNCDGYQHEAHLLVPMRQVLDLTDESAGMVAVALQAARELCDRVEAALKDHVRAGGVVEADGKRWLPSRYMADTIKDHDAVIGALLDAGATPETKTTIGMPAVRKALKGVDKDVDAFLEAAREDGVIVQGERERWDWKGRK